MFAMTTCFDRAPDHLAEARRLRPPHIIPTLPPASAHGRVRQDHDRQVVLGSLLPEYQRSR